MKEPVDPRNWPPRWPDVTDADVLGAIAETPRHEFVPAEYRDRAYEDVALPIGRGQTISQPYIVALMTQALGLTCGSRALEIGTGSGYQAAVLTHLTPHVWSVESVPELASSAAARLRSLGYSVEIRIGDGRMGWPEQAPFDGILVAAASRDVPPALIEQLADKGRLVIPLGDSAWTQGLWLIEKNIDRLSKSYLADVRFVPLVSTEPKMDTENSAMTSIRQKLQQLFEHP
jgi:protein-L-isoaspartate(D-aspartate) O-methyltransferase